MDPLSDLLRVVRLNGAYFYAVRATAPWSVRAVAATEFLPRVLPDAEHLIPYHIVTEGHGWGGIVGETPFALVRGDVLVFPHGDPHIMSSEPGLELHPEPYGTTPARYPHTVVLGPDGPPATRLVCGFLGCDLRPFNPLLGALPRVLHLRGLSGGFLQAFASQVVEETQANRAGADEVLTRLAELMFIEVLRRYLEGMSEDQRGWLAGLRDPLVGRALALLHGAPERPWTIADLAHEVAASRSVLAERFAQLVGEPPMQYLTRWRMQLAAQRLAHGGAKVASVASEVGYESEAAFSRAFKKATGVPPAAWRATRGEPARRALAGARA